MDTQGFGMTSGSGFFQTSTSGFGSAAASMDGTARSQSVLINKQSRNEGLSTNTLQSNEMQNPINMTENGDTEEDERRAQMEFEH